jgi:hypothetical protein
MRSESEYQFFFHSKQFTGFYIYQFANGLNRCVGRFLNGSRDGFWREWNEKGHMTKISYYVKGKCLQSIVFEYENIKKNENHDVLFREFTKIINLFHSISNPKNILELEEKIVKRFHRF